MHGEVRNSYRVSVCLSKWTWPFCAEAAVRKDAPETEYEDMVVVNVRSSD
jgi:hypothetical protein